MEEQEFDSDRLTKTFYRFSISFFGKYDLFIKKRNRRSLSLENPGKVFINFQFETLNVVVSRQTKKDENEGEEEESELPGFETLREISGSDIQSVSKDKTIDNLVRFFIKSEGIADEFCVLVDIHEVEKLFSCFLLIRPNETRHHPLLCDSKESSYDITFSPGNEIRVNTTSSKKIQIWSGNWNLSKSKNLSWKTLSSWIPINMDFNVLAFSVQNIGTTLFQKLLNRFIQEPYVVLKYVSCQQSHMAVLVDRVHLRDVSKIETAGINFGEGGAATLCISFCLFTTPILFASSHFPIGGVKEHPRKQIYRKRNMFAKSISKLRNKIGHPEFDITSQFHYIIWMGGFNYLCTEGVKPSTISSGLGKKILLPCDLHPLVKEKNYSEYITTFDSLSKEEFFHKSVFHNFKEMNPIEFPPTYPLFWKKGVTVSPGYRTDLLRRKIGKDRPPPCFSLLPSYPDRILTKTLPCSELRFQRYDSVKNAGVSEYAPVFSQMRINVIKNEFCFPMFDEIRDSKVEEDACWEIQFLKAKVSHRNTNSRIHGALLGVYGSFFKRQCVFGKPKIRKSANPVWKNPEDLPLVQIPLKSLEFLNQQVLSIGLFQGGEVTSKDILSTSIEEEEVEGEEEEEKETEKDQQLEKEEEEEEEVKVENLKKVNSEELIEPLVNLEESQDKNNRKYRKGRGREIVASTYLPLNKLTTASQIGKSSKFKLSLKDYDTMHYRSYIYVDVIFRKKVRDTKTKKKMKKKKKNKRKKVKN